MRSRNVRWTPARLGLAACLCAAWFGGIAQLHAADDTDAGENLENHVRVLRKGTSSKASRKAASDRIPSNLLTEENRRRVNSVLQSTGVYRELPTLEFEVDPTVYEFFRNHPDVAVSIWRAMKISQFQMYQTGREEYEADAGDGSTGIISVLYLNGAHSVVLCEGMYKSPFLSKPIQATALMHVETVYEQRADKKTYVRHTGHLYVSFPSQTVDTAAKLISPVSNLIIDRNFQEVSMFLHMMSLAMARQPGWVEQLAGQLEGVLGVRKQELLDVTAKVYVAALKRDPKTAADLRLSLEDVVEPLRNSPVAIDEPTRSKSTEDSTKKTAAAGSKVTNADAQTILKVPRVTVQKTSDTTVK
jgi:hypothetical protein